MLAYSMPTRYSWILFLVDAIILVSEVIRIFMRTRREVIYDSRALPSLLSRGIESSTTVLVVVIDHQKPLSGWSRSPTIGKIVEKNSQKDLENHPR